MGEDFSLLRANWERCGFSFPFSGRFGPLGVCPFLFSDRLERESVCFVLPNPIDGSGGPSTFLLSGPYREEVTPQLFPPTLGPFVPRVYGRGVVQTQIVSRTVCGAREIFVADLPPQSKVRPIPSVRGGFRVCVLCVLVPLPLSSTNQGGTTGGGPGNRETGRRDNRVGVTQRVVG